MHIKKALFFLVIVFITGVIRPVDEHEEHARTAQEIIESARKDWRHYNKSLATVGGMALIIPSLIKPSQRLNICQTGVVLIKLAVVANVLTEGLRWWDKRQAQQDVWSQLATYCSDALIVQKTDLYDLNGHVRDACGYRYHLTPLQREGRERVQQGELKVPVSLVATMVQKTGSGVVKKLSHGNLKTFIERATL